MTDSDEVISENEELRNKLSEKTIENQRVKEENVGLLAENNVVISKINNLEALSKTNQSLVDENNTWRNENSSLRAKIDEYNKTQEQLSNKNNLQILAVLNVLKKSHDRYVSFDDINSSLKWQTASLKHILILAKSYIKYDLENNIKINDEGFKFLSSFGALE